MSNDNSQSILRKAYPKAELFASKSTQLSNLLDEIEQSLQDLPGKIHIDVSDENVIGELSLIKRGRKWQLRYTDHDNVWWVAESSVAIKASAAQLVPKLLLELTQQQADELEQVEKGLQSLGTIQYLDLKGTGGAQ